MNFTTLSVYVDSIKYWNLSHQNFRPELVLSLFLFFFFLANLNVSVYIKKTTLTKI